MSQMDELKKYLESFPSTTRVDLGQEVDMIDGHTLVSAILIFKTNPPDLNIHVTDRISVEAHYGGVKK